jgi:hypothetical protein
MEYGIIRNYTGDSKDGYLPLRIIKLHLPIPSQNLHRRLVDYFSTIEPAQYNCEEGNHQINHQTLLPSQTKVQLKDKLAQQERRQEGK